MASNLQRDSKLQITRIKWCNLKCRVLKTSWHS